MVNNNEKTSKTLTTWGIFAILVVIFFYILPVMLHVQLDPPNTFPYVALASWIIVSLVIRYLFGEQLLGVSKKIVKQV